MPGLLKPEILVLCRGIFLPVTLPCSSGDPRQMGTYPSLQGRQATSVARIRLVSDPDRLRFPNRLPDFFSVLAYLVSPPSSVEKNIVLPRNKKAPAGLNLKIPSSPADVVREHIRGESSHRSIPWKRRDCNSNCRIPQHPPCDRHTGR